jgi:Ca2+/H+ antiporter, TMEM165/GDT1 family
VPLVIFTAALPAFFASFVEFVEALTVVLAVGVTRGWRSAWIGTLAALALLTLLVAAIGPALRLVPLHALQVVVGALLLLFGMRWLRKAILRYAGVVGLHDEDAIYAGNTARLAEDGTAGSSDRTGILIAFNAVVLEGLEVVFIVLAVGASSGALVPAALGALVAGALVGAAGLLLRRPLARVPENGLKFVVGVMLSAFGTFWTGEGLGIEWPAGDLALVVLVAGYAVVALLAVALARRSVAKLETAPR